MTSVSYQLVREFKYYFYSYFAIFSKWEYPSKDKIIWGDLHHQKKVENPCYLKQSTFIHPLKLRNNNNKKYFDWEKSCLIGPQNLFSKEQ